jgi:hypothetical protein
VTRYSEEKARSCILSDSLFPQESSQDPSHKDGRQLIPLSGCLLQGLLRINETKEPEFSDNLHLETAMMSIGDATSGDKLHETCQRVAEVAASSIFCRYYLDGILLLTHLSAYR